MERKKIQNIVLNTGENGDFAPDIRRNMPLKALLASFRFLFEEISSMEDEGEFTLRCQGVFEEKFLASLRLFLQKLDEELEENRNFFLHPVARKADSIDACNHLFLLFNGEHTFRNTLDDCLFYSLSRLMKKAESTPEKLRDLSRQDSFAGLCLDHAVFFASSLSGLLTSYASLSAGAGNGTPARLLPFTAEIPEKSFFCRSSRQAIAVELFSGRTRDQLFSRNNVFRCRKGKYTPVKLPSIRKKEEFYGYHEAKKVIEDHLGAFAEGKHNLPLLISGLPGLGKTQMTISHILSHKDFILVLPSPEELEEDLEEMITFLARYRERKFVIFFDDVDVRNIDWYFFRTFVGGSSSLPENLLIIVASNYSFPPNVASRGRTFAFPLFDEIRCQEMIGDLFLSRGMEKISPDLLSVIASDYVEAYGQKEFEELSPRTLARYLEGFLKDQAKRKKLLEFSKGEIITRPDPGLFHEQNVRLMRALYGEEVIEKMRNGMLQI